LGQDLKAKSRIFVPDSALLHGVMDEENILSYGEVRMTENHTTYSHLGLHRLRQAPLFWPCSSGHPHCPYLQCAWSSD
jgi:hypothetical protein